MATETPSAGTAPRLQRADHYLRAGNLEKAEQELQKILSATPNQPAALTMLGILRGQQGRTDESESLFLRVVKLDP